MIDLHTHLGGAVPAAVLWEILCDSGLQMEFESFDALQKFLSIDPGSVTSLDDFVGRYFQASEFIQSSPHAASTAVYHLVAKAYRRSKLEAVEVRYNPVKRLRRGLHSIDSIVMATIQGLQRASMHYPVRTGIIFSLGRELSIDSNWEIIDTAVCIKRRRPLMGAYGLVGIDLAGPESRRNEADPDWIREAVKMVEKARSENLGVTWHVGETSHTGPELMIKAIEHIQPDRIGHGIELRNAAGKEKERLCQLLREKEICLEICPSVNLVTKSIGDISEIADLVRFCHREDIRYTINTDNPYLIHTNLRREFKIVARALGPDAGLLDQAHQTAREATFLQP